MGKGGYTGGSTVIYPGGKGWSYDPLAQVSDGKKKHKPKLKKDALTDHSLFDFSLACACCKLLGVDWPDVNNDPQRLQLFDQKKKVYHKPFRNKVTQQRKTAVKVISHYVGDCAAADAKCLNRPTLPKEIRSAEESKNFADALEQRIKIHKEQN